MLSFFFYSPHTVRKVRVAQGGACSSMGATLRTFGRSARTTFLGQHERSSYQRFLPSITVTGASAASKSSNNRALTPMRRVVLSQLPSGSKAGLSENVPQPQTGAEMMRHEFAMPTVRRVIACRGCNLKLLGLVVRPKRTPFGAEGAGAAGEFGWNFSRDAKGSFAAMAASSNSHAYLLSVLAFRRLRISRVRGIGFG